MADPDWYESWAADHCRAFAVTTPAFVAAFLSWREALVGSGATEAELREATRRCLVGSPKPDFPREHLDHVQRHVADQKADRRRRAERLESSRYENGVGVCVQCGDCGAVSVPHPKWVVGGDWLPAAWNADGEPVHLRAVAACTCHRGRKLKELWDRRAEETGRFDAICSLDRYEAAIDPAWREHVAAVERAAEARRVAAAGAASLTGAGVARALAAATRPPR